MSNALYLASRTYYLRPRPFGVIPSRTHEPSATHLSSDGVPSKYREYLSRYVARVDVRSQKDVRSRQFFRLTGPLHTGILTEFFHVIRVARLNVERSPHRSRRHRVHPDPLLDEILRQRFGEGVDRAFGRGIVEQGLLALQSRDRPSV